ncbi:reverse transcriptase-like protein [Sporosarcina sp. GW1-11]|uniref:reverse transcriptase-like protein n=1 Tax=Sporosarcina sp. GW1-11 TaxID=2899126 RepID=UPI00294F064C|nr:reverse transcriptase-like protein [Sporosarcina sp. GW1-11]MDV6378635.1 reverse transcriptase-like protein [Sporosarcina sp. GW1-11]
MQVVIEWIYTSPKGKTTVFQSQEISAEEAVLLAEDIEKTGRAKQILFVDQHDSSWTVKELKSYLKGIETEPHNITIYFDGGFDWEQKTAGLGCVIYYDQSGKSYRLRKNASVRGLTSNNEAEYAALHFCLQELEILGAHHLPIRILGDSRVVINHLNEEWPAIEENLYSWANKIEAKMDTLGLQPQYELISRKSNGEADRLATQAISGIEIIATSER